MSKYPTHLVLGRSKCPPTLFSGGANVRPSFSGREKCPTSRFREGKCPGGMSGGKCPFTIYGYVRRRQRTSYTHSRDNIVCFFDTVPVYSSTRL